MYIPYLRGRQYELITVREFINKEKLSVNILPLIEPVKLSSTLISTLKEAIKSKREIIVVCNSDIEGFEDDLYSDEKEKERKVFFELLKDSNILKGFIINKNVSRDMEKYKNEGIIISNEEIVVVCNDGDYIEEYQKIFNDSTPRYTLIPEDKRFKRKIQNNVILLEDRFGKKDRNSDYLNDEDEFFSEDHLFYKEDGYKGFSDYSTIGKKFIDGGFAPYAVAIHMLYFDKERALRIHHFVSDSNLDIKDPAKKFYEAVTKLFKFRENLGKTNALNTFIDYFNNKSYPGLGSIKKLSLAHHLELIGKFLDDSDEI